MKKIKSGFRRTICILLAAVSLSMSVTSSYYGATTAYAAEAGITLELLELLLASLGVSCTTSEQLKQVKARVDGCNPTYGWSEEEYLAYQEMNSLTAGDILDLGKEGFSNTWKKLKSKVSNVVADINRAKIDFAHPIDLGTIGNVKVVRGSVTSDQIMSLFNGVPVKPYYAEDIIYQGASSDLTSGFVLIGKQTIDDNGIRCQPLSYMSSNERTSLLNGTGSYYLQCDGNSLSVRSVSSDTEESCIYTDIVSKSSDQTFYVSPYYTLEDGKYYLGGFTSYTSSKPRSNILLSKIFTDSSYDKDYTLYTTIPMYSSKEDYINSTDARTSNPVNGFLYGASSAALAIGGTIALRKGGAITQEVADAISALKAENPDATDDDINETVAGVLAGIGELDSSIEEGNDIAASSNSWLEKIHDKVSAGFDMSISAIHAAIMALGTSVTSKLDLVRSAIVDGTSALQEEVDDIREQFTVIEGGGGQEPDQDPDPDPEDPIPVWIPVLPAVVKFLKPVLNFFANPLSIITQYLHVYQKLFVGWQEWIKGTYDNVTGIFFNQMPQILNILNSLLNQAIGFPAALAPFIVSSIVEALEKIEPLPIEIPAGIPIEFPDSIPLELPEGFSIPNYMNILQEILNAINNIFTLDTAAILAAALALKGVFDGMFPDLDAIKGLFDSMKFSDDYDYPVFKMKNPDVLKNNGIGGEYIILLDFGEYAPYCVKIRGLIRCILWLAFAYTIFGHFKVHFSVE